MNCHSVRCGFTLTESLMALVVLSLVVLGVLQAITAGYTQAEDSAHAMRGGQLAEAMMEEIVGCPYSDPDGVSLPGPEPGETSRQQFDNMDDYHGFSESAGNVADLNGTAYGEAYDHFSRSASCSYGTLQVPSYDAPITGLTLVVTVEDDAGRQWQLTRFVAEPTL